MSDQDRRIQALAAAVKALAIAPGQRAAIVELAEEAAGGTIDLAAELGTRERRHQGADPEAADREPALRGP